MQSLIYLDLLDSSYWAWMVIAFFILVVLAIVLLMFTNLKDKVRDILSLQSRPPQRRALVNKQVGSSFDPQILKRKVYQLEKDYESLSEHLYTTNKKLEKMEVEMNDLRRRLGSQSQNYRQSQTEQYPPREERPFSTSSIRSQFDDLYNTRTQSSRFSERNNITPAYSDMVDLYNSSRGDQSSRERFRDKYRPFFISIANDVERRRQNLPPDFRRASNGSYLAVPQGSDKAMVFPDFTLVIVDGVYEAGALGEAFDCPNYERSFSYPNFSVVKPAVFKLNGGDSWSVENKGMIKLGQGQGG